MLVLHDAKQNGHGLARIGIGRLASEEFDQRRAYRPNVRRRGCSLAGDHLYCTFAARASTCSFRHNKTRQGEKKEEGGGGGGESC